MMRLAFNNNGISNQSLNSKAEQEVLGKISLEESGKLLGNNNNKHAVEEKKNYRQGVSEVEEEEEEKMNFDNHHNGVKKANEDDVPDETNNLSEKISNLQNEYDKSLQSMKEVN